MNLPSVLRVDACSLVAERSAHRPLARDVATLFERLAAGLPVPRDYWAALDFDPLAPDRERLG